MAQILFLGSADSPILRFLKAVEERVVTTTDPIDTAYVEAGGFDFLVSSGYRHILTKDVLELFPRRAINLHISLLPWNRGADPNLWSLVEGTPRGVTIHYIDAGVDTGDIIVQKEVAFSSTDTLATSYAKLHAELEELFFENWALIRGGKCAGRPQSGAGSSHRVKDREQIVHLLSDGWDTPIAALESAAKPPAPLASCTAEGGGGPSGSAGSFGPHRFQSTGLAAASLLHTNPAKAEGTGIARWWPWNRWRAWREKRREMSRVTWRNLDNDSSGAEVVDVVADILFNCIPD